MRAILFGGPLDRRTLDDIPDTTESMNIPANGGEPRYARYTRTGDGLDPGGPFLRFEFENVYASPEYPIL